MKLESFANEPPLDFTLSQHRERFSEAIKRWKSQMPLSPQVFFIGEEERRSERVLDVKNPSTAETIGQVYVASHEDMQQAIDLAKETFGFWQREPVARRAKVLENVADLMGKQRYELAALQTLEVGKTWVEADGDIIEAMDFCRYYAAHMRVLGGGRKIDRVQGESGLYHYVPRGVVGVIAPWNFPLAILSGMVVAGLVTGNTVVAKPAEQSPLTALMLRDLLLKAGMPAAVATFLPGFGEEIGAQLVEHPDVQMISFTGSREVGLTICEKIGQTHKGQRAVKRAIIEMGGKNAIIVDSDADLDEAVAGVLSSAFGFAGQKCSACSRAIVLESVCERFQERLVEAVSSLQVGPADLPETYLGPVIDEVAQKRLLSQIKKGCEQETVLFRGRCQRQGILCRL